MCVKYHKMLFTSNCSFQCLGAIKISNHALTQLSKINCRHQFWRYFWCCKSPIYYIKWCEVIFAHNHAKKSNYFYSTYFYRQDIGVDFNLSLVSASVAAYANLAFNLQELELGSFYELPNISIVIYDFMRGQEFKFRGFNSTSGEINFVSVYSNDTKSEIFVVSFWTKIFLFLFLTYIRDFSLKELSLDISFLYIIVVI